ncbi:MAG: WecB/TagA/CpsF family glycosyltransferase [Bacteroidales bacterium]|nr:WecB/TagA/CpsF family glycosyltransferase [Bacteroidales bacterium]
MGLFFNVRLEFDKEKVDRTIQNAIEENIAGYVCSVESNNLTHANTHPDFLKVVNGALVNICDGSVIAAMLSKIHHRKLDAYIGADLFIKYIKKRHFKQYFLGNTSDVLNGLRENLSKIDPGIKNMPFVELPFRTVDEFDYKQIADAINKTGPDIIWVSLGAPKQEIFMSKLQPYLHRGVMFGFGAIFNFFSGVGPVRRAPAVLRRMKLEWFYRALEEPKKNVPRYWRFIKILPGLIYEESKIVSGNKGRVVNKSLKKESPKS